MLQNKTFLVILILAGCVNAWTIDTLDTVTFSTDFMQSPIGTYSTLNKSYINVIANFTWYANSSGLEYYYVGMYGYSFSCSNASTIHQLYQGSPYRYHTYLYIPNPLNQMDFYKPLDCNFVVNDNVWFPLNINATHNNITDTLTAAGFCALNRTWYNSLADNEKRVRLIIRFNETIAGSIKNNVSLFNSSQENAEVSRSKAYLTSQGVNMTDIPAFSGRILSGVYTDLGCGNSATTTTTTTTTLPLNLTSKICMVSSAYTNPTHTSYVNLSNSKVTFLSEITLPYDIHYTDTQIGYTNLTGSICFNLSYASDNFYVYSENTPYYPQRLFFDDVGRIELLTLNAIYGYVWLPFERIPQYNITINVSKGNYNINMLNNHIGVKGCLNSNKNSCNENLIYNKDTDVSGNYFYNGLIITTNYILVSTWYSDVNVGSLSKDVMVNLVGYTSTSINISLNYGIQNNYEYCLDFVDKDTLGKINNTQYYVEYSDAIIISGTYLNVKRCFNSSSLGLYYGINAKDNALNYEVFDESKQLDIGDNLIRMTTTGNHENSSLYYTLNGTVYGDGIKLSSIKVYSSCGDSGYKITDANGYYLFTNITLNSNCQLQPNTQGEYDDFSRNIILTKNDTLDFNLTKNINVDNRRTITAHVGYLNIYGDIVSLSNAKVVIQCSGDNDKTKYTGETGNAIFTNMPNNRQCSILASHKDYITHDFTDLGNDNEPQIILESEANLGCFIYGNTVLVNNSLSSNIRQIPLTLIKNGVNVESKKSDDNGYYEFKTECDKEYTISGNYNGIVKSVTVKTPSSEGGVSQNMEFTVSDVVNNSYIDAILALFGAVFGFILMMMFTFLLLIFLKILSEMNKL